MYKTIVVQFTDYVLMYSQIRKRNNKKNTVQTFDTFFLYSLKSDEKKDYYVFNLYL